ncbi:hypothetical protein OG2516_13761 [Oceanicola granulosus HTCC2516]|uniref:DUF4260 domain-containing protein n=1 Tax=Oceanicola granulosus (strain ATCC BAA-861 / DSM 15982 / KCTC 12143 / HTCC2516) TaxID=314256 RepID=Q2CDZ5_OCEGH|nr:DUF4260 domain-containing protein [Oceanicola granulosus]EAR50943.1 hypothetical protein OG2516_13761 [Oceanicola granulosus HTCC2516]
MIGWQRAEGALVFLAALLLYWQMPPLLPWWAAVLIFFAPDLSFAGYALGARIGAIAYNIVHLYAFGALLFALGTLLFAPLVATLGALWLAHAGFDRMLGYGLKSVEGFEITHLGPIGRRKARKRGA